MAAFSLPCLPLSVRLPVKIACCTPFMLASCGGGDEPLGVDAAPLAYPSRSAALQAGMAASQAPFAQQPAAEAEAPPYDAPDFRYRMGSDSALEADGMHSDSFAHGADGAPLDAPRDDDGTGPPPETQPTR